MPDWMDADLSDLRRQGLYRTRRRPESAPGPIIRLRGRDLVNFASNDYLDLAADPRLARAAAAAARRHGCGAGASPLVSGYSSPLRQLERDLAAWEQTEKALVFSSGYAANLAVVSALVGRDDAIFSDELNHASLIDGCRLSRAAIHVFRHRDVSHLQDLLKHAAAARRRLIVTDSVFSMDGDFAPLPELAELAERFDAMLLIDDAHATGVLGEQGRGLTELVPPGRLNPDRLVKVGTLSKGLGAQGGFVCGARRLIDWLVNRARPYIFSTALAPPVAAAARRAVRIVAQEPERRRHVLALAGFLRDQVQAIGLPASQSQCQIVPLVIGPARAAVRVSTLLENVGYLVPAIRPPSVPKGTARLRISVTAGHREEDVKGLIAALQVAMETAAMLR